MPLLWLSVAFLLGLLLGRYQPAAWLVWAALGALGLALALAESLWGGKLAFLARRKRFCPLPLGLLLAALAFGALRFTLAQPSWSPADLAWYNDSGALRITGTVSAPPDVRDRAVLLRVEVRGAARLDENGTAAETQPMRGVLLARLQPGDEWHYGDVIELEGKLTTPPEDEEFSYRDYLARQGIYSYLLYPRARRTGQDAGSPILSAIYALQARAYRLVNQWLPQPEAALLSGILLGLDQDLPAGLVDAFQATGTAHIIAISGFNISILSALFYELFRRLLPRRWAALTALTAIAFYTLLVGASPSVVRAAVMGSLGMIAHQIGRQQAGGNSLAFSGALMSLFNPWLPWDASFQLSFMATLGLILFADPLLHGFQALLERKLAPDLARRIAGPVGDYLLLTLAAQLTTLPVIAVHFQRLSLSAVLANPLVLPPQPLVMILGGAAVLCGLIFPPLGQVLAWLSWPLLAYTNRMVELLAGLPWGVWMLSPDSAANLTWVGVYYALLAAAAWAWPRLATATESLRRRITPVAILVTLALLSGVTWRAALTLPDGRLHLKLLDVNGGPALVVQSPAGGALLIDGGQEGSPLSAALGRSLPYGAHLDALVLTRAAAAPYEGLPAVIERFPPRLVLAGQLPQSRSIKRLEDLLTRAGVEPATLEEGASLALGNGAVLRVIAAQEDGTALALEWQNFYAVLPGAIPAEDLLREHHTGVMDATVLILTPESLKATPPQGWLSLSPRLILAPGQPAEPLPEGANWLSTQARGTIHLASDGRQLWVEAER